MSCCDPEDPLRFLCDPAWDAIFAELQASDEERGALRCFVACFTDRKAARYLGRSVKSVRSAYDRLRAKAGVRNRFELFRGVWGIYRAWRFRCLPPDECRQSALGS